MSIQRNAVIDGPYRYYLSRGTGPQCGVVMLNPSTADGLEDDATIRKLMGFTRDWGYPSFVVANLFSFRATDPKVMLAAPDPVGPHTDGYLHAIATLPLVVVAWGNDAPKARAIEALRILRAPGRMLYCLGRTMHDQPKHPLYVPYSTKLLEYTQFT